jgi:uncharacterized protein YecE (DUF72 family)
MRICLHAPPLPYHNLLLHFPRRLLSACRHLINPHFTMLILAGTSGFSYKEWKGSFYPPDIKPDAMLRYYTGRFRTVEINNTFYRMPAEKMLLDWSDEAPAEFRFVLKASQRITHRKRLKDVGEDLEYFLRISSVLGDKLGPTLFQLPPNLKKDASRLTDFLALLPRRWRAALEFRHPSWFDHETYDLLRAHDVALCTADTGEGDPPVVPTASWGYLRLRREDYSDTDLEAWARKVTAQPWSEAFVFFKHEDAGTGPRLAARFMELALPVQA